MNFSCIYSIVNLVNNKIYIGSAVNFNSRKRKHLHLLKKNKHQGILQNSWNKYGEENFEFQILEIVKDKNLLLKREQVWIDFFKPELNILKNANNLIGFKHKKETKERISKLLKGRISPRKGVKLSEEQKIKCGNANRGKKYSLEINKKKGRSGVLSASYGRKHSEETKAHWRKIRKGQFSGEKHPNFGKKASSELLKKLSDSHKGIKPSKESIALAIQTKKRIRQERLTMIF